MGKIKDKRYFDYKNYQNDNSETLLKWAHSHNLESNNMEFLLAEAFSRICLQKALRQIYPEAKIVQMGMYEHFDAMVIESGSTTLYEHKFKLNDSDTYSTDDCSESKEDYISTVDSGYSSNVVFTFWDGVVRCYNLTSAENGTWTHSATTTEGGEIITDGCLKFKPEDAIWTTQISLPNMEG